MNNQVKNFLNSVNHWIVIANVCVFLLTDLYPTGSLAAEIMEKGCLGWHSVFENGEYYRLFTYMFLHSGIQHIFANMLMIFLIGDVLEKYFGRVRYTLLYFLSGILAGLSSIVYNSRLANNVISVGASGAGFGLMGALLCLMLIKGGKMQGMNFKYMIFYLVMSAVVGFMSGNTDNAAHIGGLIAGVIIGLILNFTLKPKGDRI